MAKSFSFPSRLCLAALAVLLCHFPSAGAAGEWGIDTLVRQLQGAGYRVRVEVATELGKTGSPEALSPLLQLLDDDLGDVRISAAAVMGEPDRAAAALPLLAQVSGAEAFDPLLRGLSYPNQKVRIAAANALKGLDDRRVVQKLTDALARETAEVKVAIIFILAETGDEGAIKAIVRTLDDDDSRVRAGAARVLGEIGDTHAEKPLYRHLSDSDLAVRSAILAALEKITGEKVVFREYLDAKKAFFSHPSYEAGVCTVCHDPHAASQEKLIPPSRSDGGRKLSIQLTLTEAGGTCVVGCHREQSYDRTKTTRKER